MRLTRPQVSPNLAAENGEHQQTTNTLRSCEKIYSISLIVYFVITCQLVDTDRAHQAKTLRNMTQSGLINVIVVGAGFGGLANAIELTRKGCKVTVYEAVKELTNMGK